METDPSAAAPEGERTWRFTALAVAAMVFVVYAVIAGILVVVIPEYEKLFLEMGVTLPPRTRLLLAVSRALRLVDVAPMPIPVLLHSVIASGAAFLSYKGAAALMKRNRISRKRLRGLTATVVIIVLGVVVGLIVFSLFIPLPLIEIA